MAVGKHIIATLLLLLPTSAAVAATVLMHDTGAVRVEAAQLSKDASKLTDLRILYRMVPH